MSEKTRARPIQGLLTDGFGADLILHQKNQELHDRLRNMGVTITFLHDEMIIECPPDLEEEARKVLSEFLDQYAKTDNNPEV